MKVQPEVIELSDDDEEATEINLETTTKTKKSVKNISEGVLQLNFMRRSLNVRMSEERKKTKKQPGDSKRVYPTVLGPADEAIPGLDGVVKEERYTWIEQLGFGRFSFHGQNPEIEKIRGVDTRKRKHSEDNDDKEDGELTPPTKRSYKEIAC